MLCIAIPQLCLHYTIQLWLITHSIIVRNYFSSIQCPRAQKASMPQPSLYCSGQQGNSGSSLWSGLPGFPALPAARCQLAHQRRRTPWRRRHALGLCSKQALKNFESIGEETNTTTTGLLDSTTANKPRRYQQRSCILVEEWYVYIQEPYTKLTYFDLHHRGLVIPFQMLPLHYSLLVLEFLIKTKVSILLKATPLLLSS